MSGGRRCLIHICSFPPGNSARLCLCWTQEQGAQHHHQATAGASASLQKIQPHDSHQQQTGCPEGVSRCLPLPQGGKTEVLGPHKSCWLFGWEQFAATFPLRPTESPVCTAQVRTETSHSNASPLFTLLLLLFFFAFCEVTFSPNLQMRKTEAQSSEAQLNLSRILSLALHGPQTHMISTTSLSLSDLSEEGTFVDTPVPLWP